MKLRCLLGFCNDLRRELHVTETMPKKCISIKAAVIYKCNYCGKAKGAAKRNVVEESLAGE